MLPPHNPASFLRHFAVGLDEPAPEMQSKYYSNNSSTTSMIKSAHRLLNLSF